MTKRKPFYFMKRKGKGFIRVWRTKDEGLVEHAWSDASIVVFENRAEFPQVLGNYKFEKSSNTMVPAEKDFPKLNRVIPNRNGYKKAEPIEIAEALCLLRWYEAGRHIIAMRLECNDPEDLMETWLDVEYYDYLENLQHGSEWQIKGKEEPILYLSGNDILAVIMPIKQREWEVY